jgi:hypothetical protein
MVYFLDRNSINDLHLKVEAWSYEWGAATISPFTSHSNNNTKPLEVKKLNALEIPLQRSAWAETLE